MFFAKNKSLMPFPSKLKGHVLIWKSKYRI